MPILEYSFSHHANSGGFINLSSATDAAFLFTEGSEIRSQDLATTTITTIGQGYQNLGAMLASADGKKAFVVDLDFSHHHFSIHEVKRSNADFNIANVVFKGPGLPAQLAFHDKLLFYVDRQSGRFVSIDLATKTRKTIASGLSTPSGLVLSADGKTAYICEAGAGRLISINLSTNVHKTERLGLHVPGLLSWFDKDHLLYTESGVSGLVRTLRLSTGIVKTILAHPAGNHLRGAWRHKDLLILADLHKLFWYDQLKKHLMPVTLTIPEKQPFIGSFQRVQVDFGSTGLDLNSVKIAIPDGPDAGIISYSTDDLSKPNEIMLLCGYKPGKYKIEVTDNITSTLVGSLDYEIVSNWTDQSKSPAHWMVGALEDFQTGYTWGGGPGVPQNVNVLPQSGTRNICVVTVDTTDSRYPTGSAFDTIKTTWANAAAGTTPDADGKVRSAKAYYEEVSHGTFTLSLAGGQALSVSLSNGWSDNFTMMNPPFPGNSFGPTNGQAFAQAVISAAAALTDGGGHALVDFKQVQTVIMVIRSAGAAADDNFFWPQAWGGSFSVPYGSADINVLGMPDDWTPTRDTSTPVFQVLCHEIGHNLGYPDLYTSTNSNYSAQIIARDINDWDLMAQESQLPHMSVGQKMETGWVKSEWVMPFDFSRSTIPLDQTVTLHAVELGAPPAGEFSAVEIRIADGWNYYFEYRKGQLTQIGDQLLGSTGDTADGVVLGTDMISQSFTYPIARPQIMRLEKDAEGEDSFFGAGEDYKETDTSSMAIADFRMSVLSTSGNTAKVKIEYGTNGRPDLYIRPWPGGDDWQSPDIIVQNDKSLADPGQWANQPWLGHPNTLIARYRNRGPVTAANVRVDFYIKDFTVGGAPEVHLGSMVKDVPPETITPFVEFSTSWIPQDDGHKCIIARTPLYIDTSVNPNIVELTDTNNTAQTNYTKYIAASASPAKRGIFDVSLHNPFDKKTDIYVIPQIRGPFASLYRMYLEHSSLRLNPGETQKVQVMVESLYGDPQYASLIRQFEGKFFVDTRMSLTGYGIPPEAPTHPVLLGGVQVNVGSGKGTKFSQFAYLKDENFVRGQVVTLDGSGVVTGMVLLNFRADPERVGTSIPVTLGNNGTFFLRIAGDYAQKFQAKSLTAHYLGRPGLAPCDAVNEIDF